MYTLYEQADGTWKLEYEANDVWVTQAYRTLEEAEGVITRLVRWKRRRVYNGDGKLVSESVY